MLTGHLLKARAPDMAQYSTWISCGAGDGNRTRTISLGICAVRAVTWPDLRVGVSASDRERPLVAGVNGPLMARRAVALPALDGLFLAAFLDPWGCPAGNLFCFNSHPAPVNAVIVTAVQRMRGNDLTGQSLARRVKRRSTHYERILVCCSEVRTSRCLCVHRLAAAVTVGC
jgi:hypothetical protein